MRASTVTADDPVVKVPEEVKVCILKPPAVVTVPPVGRPILNCVVVAGLRHKAVDPVIAGGAVLTVTAKVLTMLFSWSSVANLKSFCNHAVNSQFHHP